MALPIDQNTYNALKSRRVKARDFVWFTVRNRSTGAKHSEGFWNGNHSVDAQVTDIITGNDVVRTFRATSDASTIGDVARTDGLTAESVTIDLPSLDQRVRDLLLGYDPKFAPVQIHRGVFDRDTGNLIGPCFPRFFGEIDDITITTPAVGSVGNVRVTVKNANQEMLKGVYVKKADSEQQRRGGDRFYLNASVVAEIPIFWGREKT